MIQLVVSAYITTRAHDSVSKGYLYMNIKLNNALIGDSVEENEIICRVATDYLNIRRQ